MKTSSILATPLKEVLKEIEHEITREAFERVNEWLVELEDRIEKVERVKKVEQKKEESWVQTRVD